MSILDFLTNGRKYVHVAYFDHGTSHGKDAKEFVENYCLDVDIPMTTSTISGSQKKDQSKEMFWREKRYDFFNSFDLPMITCHHLDDVIETWIMTSLRGTPKTIPYRRDHII